MRRLWYRMWQRAAQVVFCAFFSLRVWGRENVPNAGPVVLVSNHQSYLDPILCGLGLGRELDYIARDSLFRNPAFGWFIRSLNAFPIQRGQADLTALRAVIQRLQKGRAVTLFPEATRTADGRIRPIKGGFELIARKSGATTVPVVIDGAFEAWPRQQMLPTPGRIVVIYGPPISSEQAGKMSREEFVAQINHQLRKLQIKVRRLYGRKPCRYND